MTRSTVHPLSRLLTALALTGAALFGSVGFASAASADDDTSATSYSQTVDTDEDAAKAAAKAAEDATKAAAKAAEDAAKAAEKAAENERKAAEKAAKDAAKAAEKAAKQNDDEDDDDDAVAPAPVAVGVDYDQSVDAIDRLGNVLASRAPQMSPQFEALAPKLRAVLAKHLTKKGVTVIYDARGRLVIAPYLCDAKKPTFMQPGCVTSLPTDGGGGRF